MRNKGKGRIRKAGSHRKEQPAIIGRWTEDTYSVEESEVVHVDRLVVRPAEGGDSAIAGVSLNLVITDHPTTGAITIGLGAGAQSGGVIGENRTDFAEGWLFFIQRPDALLSLAAQLERVHAIAREAGLISEDGSSWLQKGRRIYTSPADGRQFELRRPIAAAGGGK